MDVNTPLPEDLVQATAKLQIGEAIKVTLGSSLSDWDIVILAAALGHQAGDIPLAIVDLGDNKIRIWRTQ